MSIILFSGPGAEGYLSLSVEIDEALDMTWEIEPPEDFVSADYLILYPGSTQLPVLRITDSTDAAVAGATVTVTIETQSTNPTVVTASTGFSITDNGDGSYAVAMTDAARDALKYGTTEKPRIYDLHVVATDGDIEGDTRTELRVLKRAATIVAAA